MTDWERRRKVDAKLAYEALMKFYPFTLDGLVGEIWKPIKGYEEFYHVSNYGRVKSFYGGKIKILKPAFDACGYLYLGLKRNGTNKNFKIHRLVAEAFLGNPEDKPCVNHIDGCKTNCHFSNLEWVTHSENNQHAVKAGLMKVGEERSGAKLSNNDVAYIRENADSLTMTELAEKFNVTPAKISEIQLGKKYKSVGGVIRKKLPYHFKIPHEVRKQIRTEYIQGDRMFGAHALGKKYGVNATTIWRIVHEQD